MLPSDRYGWVRIWTAWSKSNVPSCYAILLVSLAEDGVAAGSKWAISTTPNHRWGCQANHKANQYLWSPWNWCSAEVTHLNIQRNLWNTVKIHYSATSRILQISQETINKQYLGSWNFNTKHSGIKLYCSKSSHTFARNRIPSKALKNAEDNSLDFHAVSFFTFVWDVCYL